MTSAVVYPMLSEPLPDSERDERSSGPSKKVKIIGLVGVVAINVLLVVTTVGNVEISTKFLSDKQKTPSAVETLAIESTVSQSFKTFRPFNPPVMDGSQNTSLDYDVRLKAPFTCVLSGPTGSGKTELIAKMVQFRDYVTNIPPEEVIYCYGAWQERFNKMKNVSFHEGLIDIEKLPSDLKHRWVIIDDLMEEASKTSNLTNLFTKYSHHKNISVIFVTQNLFHKNLRTITLQAQYIALFKNPRDKSAPAHLGRQFYPTNTGFLVDAYEDATSAPYSYLWLDLKQTTPENVRVLGNFLTENPLVAYIPK